MVKIILTVVIALILLELFKAYITKQSKKNKSKAVVPSYIAETPVDEESASSVPHKKSTHLATENEQKLYFALQKAVPDQYIIHCQVSLMALVQPENFKDNSKTWAKRMDFVITDRASKVFAVIELDDWTHTKEKRKKRDEYVNAALDGHHPLIRIQTENFYKPEDITVHLREKTEIRFPEEVVSN